MNNEEFERPQSFEEALEIINQSPTLRKIKSYIDKSDMSADMKAIIYDVAKLTVKIGEVVISIGRRVFEIAITLVKKFPNTAIGALVGAVIATVLAGTLGASHYWRRSALCRSRGIFVKNRCAARGWKRFH